MGPEASLHAYTYDMTHISTVNIDDPSGSIQIHGGLPGTEGQIEALSDSSVTDPLHFLQNKGGGLTVQVTQPANGSAVLLNLGLPQNMALHVTTHDGNIEVDGTSGSLNLQATRSILLNNENISGQSSITSLNGRVQITNSALSGQYAITSLNGPITLPQVALSGQGQIQTQGGALIMGGTLDPQGSYTFATSGGQIALVLPDTTTLHLRVDQGSGGLTSDFPVNDGSGAQVTVKTESGDIQIRRVP